jgi:hypothetical protein
VYEVKPTNCNDKGIGNEDDKTEPIVTACKTFNVNCVLFCKKVIVSEKAISPDDNNTTTVNFMPKLRETIHTMLYFDEI